MEIEIVSSFSVAIFGEFPPGEVAILSPSEAGVNLGPLLPKAFVGLLVAATLSPDPPLLPFAGRSSRCALVVGDGGRFLERFLGFLSPLSPPELL